MKYYNNSPEAMQQLRGTYMEHIIGDFGESFLVEPKQLKAFGTRLTKEYDTGKLGAVLAMKWQKKWLSLVAFLPLMPVLLRAVALLLLTLRQVSPKSWQVIAIQFNWSCLFKSIVLQKPIEARKRNDR